MDLVAIARKLRSDVSELRFGPPVTHVYNPLDYAWRPHAAYLHRWGRTPKEVLLLGMNPGPWGMAQTGVPFGEIATVRDWLQIREEVDRPASVHPKRPVLGFDCVRTEVSGQRFWGWIRRRFGHPDAFFDRFFVYNYCPLMFLEQTGRNRTPDRLLTTERESLVAACDRALRRAVQILEPRLVVGIGGFAAGRAEEALKGTRTAVGRILHPSPASPAANRGWDEAATRQLSALGIDLPGE